MNTILQDADAVSNALKVISMRIRGTSTSALEEIGEDTEGLIEDASKLYATVKQLTKTTANPQGISILTDDGAYRSTYEILVDIGEVWKQLDDMSKAGLLEALAGKTRGSALAAILENVDILKDAYTTAEESAGASEKAMSIAMDTIDAKLTMLSNSWQTFWQNAISSESVKTIVDGLNSIVTALDALISTYGFLPTTLTIASGIAGAKNVGRVKMFTRILCKPTPLLVWQHRTRFRLRKSGIYCSRKSFSIVSKCSILA